MAVQIINKELEQRIERVAKAKGGISKHAVVLIATTEYVNKFEQQQRAQEQPTHAAQ